MIKKERLYIHKMKLKTPLANSWEFASGVHVFL